MYIIFDCDNTLVLSEALAFETYAKLANEILAKQNLGTQFTGPDLMAEFVGQNFRGIIRGLERRFRFTLSRAQQESYLALEEQRVIATLKAKLKACDGANEQLQKLRQSRKHGMAIVSSSAQTRILASIKAAGQEQFFDQDKIFSAATSLPVPTTKPDPAVYIFACGQLNVRPDQCVAVEDSRSGVLSAVRAGIPTIAYTGSYEDPLKAECVGQLLLKLGASAHMKHWSELPNCVDIILRDETDSARTVVVKTTRPER